MITLPIVTLVVVGVALWALRRGNLTVVARRSLIALGVVAVLFAVVAVAPIPLGASGFVVIQILLAAVVVAILVVWATSRLPRGRAQAWADAHGVEVTDANSEFVVRYVTEGHRLRLICGFGGAIALLALSRGFGVTVPVSGWVWLMGGYLVGVVWSEAWLTRPPAGTRRSASLTPRRVSDYLVARLRVAQVVVPLGSILCGVVVLVRGPTVGTDGMTGQFSEMSVETLRWFTAGIALGVVVLTMGIAWLQRHIIIKPQPVGDPSLIAADDAVRASAVHLLSGTTIGIVLVCIGTQLMALGALGYVSESFGGLGNLVTWLAALVAWRYYGHRAWVVRRSEESPVSPPPERVPSRGAAS